MAESCNENNFSEKPAVKTTIVGGRPPGSGKELDSIPRGIEILVKKASVDSAFKDILLKERAAAAGQIKLSLEETEIAMLNGIPQAHLEGMISATKVSPNMRQIFLGCTAAVMLAALTTTEVAACDNPLADRSLGSRPDYNRNEGFDVGERTFSFGVQPDDPIKKRVRSASRGMQSDVVEYQKMPEAYFRISEADKKLETGTLKVTVSSVGHVDSAAISFYKTDSEDSSGKPSTAGKGYISSIKDAYTISVPVGTYLVFASREERGDLPSVVEAAIYANKETLLNIALPPEIKFISGGIQPDLPE